MHSSFRLTSAILAASAVLASCTPANSGPVASSSSASSAPVVTSSSSSRAAVSSTPPSSQVPPPAATSSKPQATVDGTVQTLDVPFAPQAPFANWDALHQETCEEMSLIMVQRYLTGESLTEQQAEDEVQSLVSWMTDKGYGWDVTIGQIAEIAKDHYGLNPRIINDVSVASIVAELKKGNPVIIPAAGRELGNPYFSGEGPWYHMLVITGYKKGAFGERFVTNDPGTKRGEAYEYTASVLVSAIHDWTGVKEETNTGPKRMLVLSK